MPRGGKRPGAGRKPKAPPAQVRHEGDAPVEPKRDPLTFLLDTVNDASVDRRTRVRAAIAAAQYTHVKKGDGGKKDEKGDAADKASKGRFGQAAGPRLATANGKPVNGAA